MLSKPDLQSDIDRVSSGQPVPGDLSAATADEAVRQASAAARAGENAQALAGTSADAIATASLDPISELNEKADTEQASGIADGGAEVTREASLEPGDELQPIPVPKPEVKIKLAPVTDDVNLRARPKNGSKVIMVVPRRSSVQVISCDYWCEVIYQGTRGWIYKSFIRRTKS